MGSNLKQTQLGQKAIFEKYLKERTLFLSENEVEASKIKKDAVVKKFQAKIDAINARIKTIAANEEKTAELLKAKAEKAAAPKKAPEETKEKKEKAAPSEESKPKKKKKE